jgi:prepilin-type N-terminal cleavage/methylation domain-containing protein
MMTQKGFTLLELIAAMVIVGVAAAMAGVSFMSFSSIGKAANARNAQLAQQRLELILAEKLYGDGFPQASQGVSGPDPCQIYSLGITACDDSLLTVEFKDNDGNAVCNGTDLENCEATVTVDGITYTMLLYNY